MTGKPPPEAAPKQDRLLQLAEGYHSIGALFYPVIAALIAECYLVYLLLHGSILFIRPAKNMHPCVLWA